MPRLSSPLHEIKDHYTVLVIGSGYGGAIAASRLARAGQQVCVLERGREFQTGEYPDTEAEALAEMQAELPNGHSGSRTGLYDFYVNPDVNVFVGCGLGGTSLINGNVAVRAEPRVFDDTCWPQALRDDMGGLEEGYQRAEEMLRPVAYPAQYPALPKLLALEQSAAHLGQTCSRPPIAVTLPEGVKHVGVEQRACMLCGDCITGCNYGAKNTVMFNYLPDARNFGAEIYTQVSVRRLERKDGRRHAGIDRDSAAFESRRPAPLGPSGTALLGQWRRAGVQLRLRGGSARSGLRPSRSARYGGGGSRGHGNDRYATAGRFGRRHRDPGIRHAGRAGQSAAGSHGQGRRGSGQGGGRRSRRSSDRKSVV